MRAWLANPWGRPRFLRVVTWVYVAWSLLPVLLAVRFAFNDGRSRTVGQGWSIRWFWGDKDLSVVGDPTLFAALKHSMLLAVIVMAVSVPLGTALAIGMRRWRGPVAATTNVLLLLPLVTPELVLAVGLFLLFTTALDVIGLGTTAQAIGQVTFTLSWVVLIVRARLATIGGDVEEAAADLGAPPHHVYGRVLLPLLVPAMVASLLVAFALSIDDFVISQYLASGADTTTVPMRIYSQARGGPTPALNALATVMLLVSLLALGLAYFVFKRLSRGEPDASAAAIGTIADSMSGAVALEGLTKRFGDHLAVAGVDMEIPAGEFFTMLGPSGCGKTTTLRLIAGFERPDEGKILLDGKDVSQTPPHKRPVNTVFQSYALFPHRNVAENIAFGLRYRKVSKSEAAQKVADAVALVRLEGFENRHPAKLSGGQQQRVALARALVLEPPVLLLDEPLGALDARLRLDLQVELKRIQEQVGITFIYVTHDQDEALTMSDRVAVMKDGLIEQCAVPRELYERPSTAFVANFLGSSNLLDVTVNGTDLALGTFTLRCVDGRGCAGEARVMIRPESVKIEPRGGESMNRLPGMVEEVVYLGFHTEVRVRLASGALLKADVHEDAEHEPGDAVAVHLPPEHLRVLAS